MCVCMFVRMCVFECVYVSVCVWLSNRLMFSVTQLCHLYCIYYTNYLVVHYKY